MAGMRVLSLTGDKVETHDVSEVEALSKQDDLLVWVDVPECGDEAVRLLTDVPKCHPLAVRDCMQRNRVPRVRIYPHQQLLIMHGTGTRPLRTCPLHRIGSDNRRQISRHRAWSSQPGGESGSRSPRDRSLPLPTTASRSSRSSPATCGSSSSGSPAATWAIPKSSWKSCSRP